MIPGAQSVLQFEGRPALISIWLPADAHRRLLEGLPRWSAAHGPLNDATETESAVGMRRVSCRVSDAMALLQFAERLQPESAPLIRNAIRRAGSTQGMRRRPVPLRPAPPRRRAPDRSPRRLDLHRLATLYLLVLAFPLFHGLERSREILRRLL